MARSILLPGLASQGRRPEVGPGSSPCRQSGWRVPGGRPVLERAPAQEVPRARHDRVGRLRVQGGQLGAVRPVQVGELLGEHGALAAGVHVGGRRPRRQPGARAVSRGQHGIRVAADPGQVVLWTGRPGAVGPVPAVLHEVGLEPVDVASVPQRGGHCRRREHPEQDGEQDGEPPAAVPAPAHATRVLRRPIRTCEPSHPAGLRLLSFTASDRLDTRLTQLLPAQRGRPRLSGNAL